MFLLGYLSPAPARTSKQPRCSDSVIHGTNMRQNAYPTLYVLLWIPGIVNRLMEATGRTPSNPRAVAALQSTSQFVGFANALTFGVNATLRRRIGSAAVTARQKLKARAEAWRNV